MAPSRSIDELKTSSPVYRAIFDELASLGFAEGHNLVVDRYSGGGHMDSYPELARTVVNNNPGNPDPAGPMTLALVIE